MRSDVQTISKDKINNVSQIVSASGSNSRTRNAVQTISNVSQIVSANGNSSKMSSDDPRISNGSVRPTNSGDKPTNSGGSSNSNAKVATQTGSGVLRIGRDSFVGFRQGK